MLFQNFNNKISFELAFFIGCLPDLEKLSELKYDILFGPIIP